jgi:hypothetical protein
MKGRSPTFKQVPLNIVGSTKFGRYPKISVEQTYNMIISDGFLVPFAGHLQVAPIANNAQGRAIYTSVRYNHMIVVIANNVYSVSPSLAVSFIGSIATFQGDVYIDENNTNQIAICDRSNIYIYNWETGSFTTATDGSNPTLGFIPGYITYQNGRFVAASLETAQWRLSNVGDGTVWPNDSFHVGLLQTKPDNVVATQRVPSRGNLLYVFGSTVTEIWQDIGSNLFPYQRNSSVNIDYGCLNAATIAFNDTIVVWLAANEKSGPMIAYSMGGDIKKISTDGIDFKFTQLTNPSNSYGFLFRQDGHLIYQITFPDDNLTYIYDFNTDKFFTLTDESVNAHIAKRVAFFNDNYFFVSFVDGNLYELSTTFTTYNGAEIPRFRICNPIRLPDASRFSIPNLTFTIEQGTQDNSFTNFQITGDELPILTEDGQNLLTEDGQILLTEGFAEGATLIPQRVGLSVSKNGGESFGTIWMKELNARGLFRNRLNYWQLGAANDLTVKIQFWGLSRFVATDGVVNIYQ